MKGAYSKPVLRQTFFPAAAVLAARFVGYDGAQIAAAGAAAAAISIDDVTATDIADATATSPTGKACFTGGIEGIEKLEAGAQIASVGLELTSDASGRGIPAVAGQKVNAISWTTCDAAGEFVAAQKIVPYTKA
jgi:hypothetical protein